MSSTYNSLTVARGLSVLVMPSIHTVMVYSQPFIHHTALGLFLRFFAECVSSHLYMFLMGFYLAIGRPRPLNVTLKRASLLFVAGYLLNVFRIYLPGKAGWLPLSFMAHYGATQLHVWPLILTGDILQFAGIGYALTGILNRIPGATGIGCLLYVGIAAAAPSCWGVQSTDSVANHFLQLFVSNNTQAFFPVLPWLCYPLAGMIAGKWSLHQPAFISVKTALLTGLGLSITGIIIYWISPTVWEWDFYRSGPGGTLLHTGLVVLWLVLIRSLSKGRGFLRWLPLFQYCDKHITAIYLLHWVVVGWGIGLAGYQALDLYSTLLALLLVNLITATLVWLAKGKEDAIYRPVTN